MKLLTHPAMLALAVAMLCLLMLVGPLVSPAHLGIYHISGSASSIFAAVMIDLCVLWMLLILLFALARRSSWFHTIFWTSIIVVLPALLVRDWFAFTSGFTPPWVSTACFLTPVVIFAITLVARRPTFSPLFESVRAFSSSLLGFASLSALLILVQLLWFSWQARTLNAPRTLHSQLSSGTPSPKSKVIWILFDELSYQQVYEERFQGLQLPAFDQLAGQSTVFTHVVPAGIFTEFVIPSLMTGQAVDHIRASADGSKLSLHDPNLDRWNVFDPHQTVFQDALNHGYSTAIAGWFNPYCRILASSLDRCTWSSSGSVNGGMIPGRSLIWNSTRPVIHYFEYGLSQLHLTTRKTPDAILDTQFHLMAYLDLFKASDKLLSDPAATFVFLHMPIPHLDGIYDRLHSTFTTGSSYSYIDNLALTDQYLAHVRSILCDQGEWDASTVIIMGDHSWRTKLMQLWTPEDLAASHGGQFDDRPAYIVKMPYQQTPARIDFPFAAIHTRTLLDGIIDGRLKTPEDLVAWAAQQP